MNTLRVETARPYDVHVGAGVLGRVHEQLAGGAAIVSDATVAEKHLARLELDDTPALVVEPGEESKGFATLEGVLEFLAEMGLDRDSVVVALGGGVVGDLAGLAASLYMRGIAVVQCPTTLLAMVDAAIGGKTAVNLPQAKNLAGTIHQPRAVYADTATLASLPRSELASGLGEVIKSAIIGDGELLDFTGENAAAIAARDADVLTEIVVRCVAVKARVVADDENEAGGRFLLNLGHTFGHAIEHVAGYGRIPHGVAVAVGLVLALRASAETGLLADGELPDRVGRTLSALGLPGALDELRRSSGQRLAATALRTAMGLDKKGRAGIPRFVLVRDVGRLESGVELEEALLDRLLAPTKLH